jgi:hypothetical protein
VTPFGGETIGAPSRRIEELNAALSGHWSPSSEANVGLVPLLLPTPQRRVRNFPIGEVEDELFAYPPHLFEGAGLIRI